MLDAGPNPSTDYYVRPRLEGSHLPVAYRSVHLDEPTDEDLDDGTFVIVVRYLSPRWMRALEARHRKLAGLAYFMDDDLWDATSQGQLPLAYRARLARRATVYAPWIWARATQLWMSTPALAARYPAARAEVLSPMAPVEGEREVRPSGERVRVVYHGTRAHLDELRWLVPVLRRALTECPELDLDVIGGDEARALVGDLPRTRIHRAMSWTDYRVHARGLDAHIALAPLLESRVNAARSSTKVFDSARLGAVGLYATPGPYDVAIANDVDGCLLPMLAARWSTEIIALVRDRPRLERLRIEAARKLSPPRAAWP